MMCTREITTRLAVLPGGGSRWSLGGPPLCGRHEILIRTTIGLHARRPTDDITTFSSSQLQSRSANAN